MRFITIFYINTIEKKIIMFLFLYTYTIQINLKEIEMIVHKGNILTVGDAINIVELQGDNDLLPSWYFGPEVDELMEKAHLTPWVDHDIYSREEQFENIENNHIKSIQARTRKFMLKDYVEIQYIKDTPNIMILMVSNETRVVNKELNSIDQTNIGQLLI